MHVDDQGVARHPEGTGLELAVDGRERVIERVHVDPAEQADHQHALACGRLEHPGPPAGGVGKPGIVQRAQQPRLAVDEGQGLALVPGMVAERQAVGAGLEQLGGGAFGDPEARGGVLGVHHHELQAQPAAQGRQVPGQPLSPRAPDHVAEEPQPHACSLPKAR